MVIKIFGYVISITRAYKKPDVRITCDTSVLQLNIEKARRLLDTLSPKNK